MLFRFKSGDEAFVRALRDAIAARRLAAARALLASHGSRAFALVLSDLSGQAIANAMAMLPITERTQVLSKLSRAARRRLREAEGGSFRIGPAASVSSLLLPM